MPLAFPLYPSQKKEQWEKKCLGMFLRQPFPEHCPSPPLRSFTANEWKQIFSPPLQIFPLTSLKCKLLWKPFCLCPMFSPCTQ